MDQVKVRRSWFARGAMLLVSGAAVVALLPIGASAASAESGGLADLVQTVQSLTGQVNTNTSSIQALQGRVTTLEGTVSAQQTQLNLQAGQIAALQDALAAETSARQAGDTSTLASAKSYTDNALLNLNAGSDNDQALQDAITANTNAIAANAAAITAEANTARLNESHLQFGIDQAESDLQAGDASTFGLAVGQAVSVADTNLQTVVGNSATYDEFRSNVALGF
jgi:hypothetical protein